MNEQQIRFTLTPEDRKRIDDALQPGVVRWSRRASRCYVLLGAAYAVIGIAEIVQRHPNNFWPIFHMFLACFWSLTGLWMLRRQARNSRYAAEGTLTVSDAGISGSLDGNHVDFGWARVCVVRDLGGYAAVVPRESFQKPSPPIVIPWPNISDSAAFWRMCEDHLISKRGLIRPPGTRRMIVNTAS